jgi:hypothetical protein
VCRHVVLSIYCNWQTCLPKSHERAEQLSVGARQFVCDAMLWFARRQLERLPRLPAWLAVDDNDGAGIFAIVIVVDLICFRVLTCNFFFWLASDVTLPQFSLNPSPYVTQVGEHLLSLPQQLSPVCLLF